MADIEVWGVEKAGSRVSSLKVRFKGVAERTIDRETALAWLAGGHSMILYSGSPHHAHRHGSLERVEAEGEAWLRTDTRPEPADHVEMPGHGAH